MTSAQGDNSCYPAPGPLLASLPLWDPDHTQPSLVSLAPPGPAEGASLQGTQGSPLLLEAQELPRIETPGPILPKLQQGF